MTAAAEPVKARIAIVEDDAALLNALVFALEADGYAVTSYGEAESALSRPPHVDCLVIDQKLPGMDGLSLIARLRALEPQPPAILITTNPDQRLRRAAATAKVQIVEKPLMGGELRQRILEALADRATPTC
jgi:two-component system C4-dicarboxylate transport response regulator DctD